MAPAFLNLFFKFSHAAVLQSMFFSHIQNFSSVFREVYKGKGIVLWNMEADTLVKVFGTTNTLLFQL